MDRFVDDRDFKLLDADKYTFFVLRRIMAGETKILLSDHERLIVCFTGEPYPAWIWTPDDATDADFEKAYSLAKENGLMDGAHTFNVKYNLAEYFIKKEKEAGRNLSISTNMFAYDCPNPIKPTVKAEGKLHLCEENDLDELTEILDLFHQDIGIDKKDMAGYREDAKKFIESGKMYFWQDGSGKNVASCKWGPNGEMAAINLVYTRKDARRKHYAENLVYEVTRVAKEAGFLPMLYTDADYVASNACYEKIGYILRGKLCTISHK